MANDVEQESVFVGGLAGEGWVMMIYVCQVKSCLQQYKNPQYLYIYIYIDGSCWLGRYICDGKHALMVGWSDCFFLVGSLETDRDLYMYCTG